MSLQLVVDNTVRLAPGVRMLALCDALLGARRDEYRADLAWYSRKLRDLRALDPADRTGLRRLYRLHVRRLRRLLARLDD